MPATTRPKIPVCSECGKINANPLNPLGRAIVRRMAAIGLDSTGLGQILATSQGGLHRSMHNGNMTLPMLERVAKVLKTTSSALMEDAESGSAADKGKKAAKR